MKKFITLDYQGLIVQIEITQTRTIDDVLIVQDDKKRILLPIKKGGVQLPSDDRIWAFYETETRLNCTLLSVTDLLHSRESSIRLVS